jgi:hypothetical protein
MRGGEILIEEAEGITVHGGVDGVWVSGSVDCAKGKEEVPVDDVVFAADHELGCEVFGCFVPAIVGVDGICAGLECGAICKCVVEIF